MVKYIWYHIKTLGGKRVEEKSQERLKRWYLYMQGYDKEHYETIHIRVLRGRKSLIQAVAAERGMSVNEYINGLIEADMRPSKAKPRKRKG